MHDGICYQQELPEAGPLWPAGVDFIVGVQRYFVGDWVVARERMLAVASAGIAFKSDIRLQAYLYLARISLQQGNTGDAGKFLKSANAINEKDQASGKPASS